MSKPGGDPSSGISLGDVLRRPKRHPACRRREAQPGSCTERENLIGDAKGKGASGANREAESTDAPARGGLLRSSDEAGVMPVERRERAIAIWLGSTGNGRNPMFNGRRQPSRGGTSRMTRECQVRFCEGLGVKFPGPTRQTEKKSPRANVFRVTPESGHYSIQSACLKGAINGLAPGAFDPDPQSWIEPSRRMHHCTADCACTASC
jgi:hypothetical protein